MFITNALSPTETLAEILQKSSSTIADTDWFKTKTHNADLCPMFESIGIQILRSYKAYRTSCLDIQGMRDNGVDVYLKYDSEDGVTKIGLQIKSYPEIADWVAKKDKTFVKTLKAQYAEATQNLGLEHYFLILCTDAYEHEEQIGVGTRARQARRGDRSAGRQRSCRVRRRGGLRGISGWWTTNRLREAI